MKTLTNSLFTLKYDIKVLDVENNPYWLNFCLKNHCTLATPHGWQYLRKNSYNFLQEICHLKLFLSSHNLIDLPSSFSASLSLRSLIFFLLRFLSSRCLTHSDNVINTSSTITVVPHAIHSLHSKSVF